MGLFVNKLQQVNKVVLVPLDQLVSNRAQPRTTFEEKGIEELAVSIRQSGLLQPVTVRRRKDGRYELIAGERRTKAFRYLGETAIPAIIEDMADEESALFAILENVQRKDLNYFEEAAGLSALLEQTGMTQQKLSAKLGRSQSAIANKIRLLGLSPECRRLLVQGDLTERHARALLPVKERPDLPQIIRKIIERGLNVRETEELVEGLGLPPGQKPTRLFVVKDVRLFLNTIKKAVKTMEVAGIPVNSVQEETDDYVEYKVRIPKTAIYKNKDIHTA